jgi:hypothetical protein
VLIDITGNKYKEEFGLLNKEKNVSCKAFNVSVLPDI